jgi:hypothetical protein
VLLACQGKRRLAAKAQVVEIDMQDALRLASTRDYHLARLGCSPPVSARYAPDASWLVKQRAVSTWLVWAD